MKRISEHTTFILYTESSPEFVEFKDFCGRLLEQDLKSLDTLNEGILDFLKSIPSKLKDAYEFIKEVGKVLGENTKEFIKALGDSRVYSILKHFGFSIAKIFEKIKEGYNYFVEFRESIFKYFVNINPLNTTEFLKKIDDFIAKYPKTKYVAGAGLAYLLYYIWVNLISFTGDPEFDFNVSDIYNALLGKVGFADIFGGTNGAKMITFILVNKISGLSFPWGSWFNPTFYYAIAYTILKAVGSKVKWQKPSEVERIDLTT